MMTCAEFRAVRDANALAAMDIRLPVLKRAIEALERELAPLYKALRGSTSKHEREKAYAQFDGRDWTLQRLTAERDSIMARQVQLSALRDILE